METARRLSGINLVQAAVTTMHWEIPMDPPDEPDLRRAWDEGCAMTLDEGLAYARGA